MVTDTETAPTIDELLKESDWDARLADARARRQAVMARRAAMASTEPSAAGEPSAADPEAPNPAPVPPAADPVAERVPASQPPRARQGAVIWAAGGAVAGLAAGMAAFALVSGWPARAPLGGFTQNDPAPWAAMSVPTRPLADAPLSMFVQLGSDTDPLPARLASPPNMPDIAAVALPPIDIGPARVGPSDAPLSPVRPSDHVVWLSGTVAAGRAERLQSVGFQTAQRDGAPFATGRSVRYFHAQDAAAAANVAYLTDAVPRDFTAYAPKPPLGTIEAVLTQ